MPEINENEFWLGLWKITNEELERHDDPTVPLHMQFSVALERVTLRVEPAGDWYRVRGEETPEPLPAEPVLNMFICGVLLGNLMAWKRGVKFWDRLKPEH